MYLHVVLVINSMALSPKRGWETGEGSHLNYPVTTITQTKAPDGREWKIAENIDTPEKGLCMYSKAKVGEGVMVGGREGDFKWRVGGMGGGGSTVLISCCTFSFPANPETRPQLCTMQQVAEKPPVLSILGSATGHSFAFEVAFLDVFRYVFERKPLDYFWGEKETASSPGPDPACPPVSQAAGQPATPCTHAAYSAIKTMLL